MTVQERISTVEDLPTWRRQLIHTVLRWVVFIGIPALILGVLDAIRREVQWTIPLYVAAYIVAAVATFWRRVPLPFQVGVILAVVYGLALADLASLGLEGDAQPYLVALPLLAVIFFGRRGGIISMVLVALTMLVFGWLYAAGHLHAPSGELASSADGMRWVTAAAAILMLDILVVGALSQLLARFTTALTQSRSLAQEVGQRAQAEQEQRQRLQATVAEYVTFVSSVAQGNLTARLSLDGEDPQADPLTVLGHNLNEMVDNLREMTVRTKSAAQQLGAAAAAIFAATSQLAAGAGDQSAAIAQTSSTIDEVRTISEQTAQRAQGVTDLAQRTTAVSQAGRQAVDSTVQGMEQIKAQVESIAEEILTLSEQTQTISEIITTVNEIATKSNLLALNAAVEAARAGKAGRGFAIVAQEVRSLAEQSQEATEQVKDILSEIQRGVNAAVMATGEGTKGADVGTRLAGEAGRAIQELADSVSDSTQAAVQISAAAGQQLTGMEQIALAMEHIHQVAAQSVAGTQRVEQAAEELNSLAGQLRELVGQYQL